MSQPPIETLLFNDIIEEKSVQLRDIMDKFLQVHSFSRFESEFNLFIRRIKHIAKDGQRNGANLTRHSMQMPSNNDTNLPRHSMQMPSNNGAQPSNRTMEDGGSHVINTNEPANAFKKPSVAKTTLTRDSQSNNIRNKTIKFCEPIIEESLINNDIAQNDTQQPEFLPPTVPSQNNNASPTSFDNKNDDDAMEFELVEAVQTPNSSDLGSDDTTASQLSQDQSNGSVRSLRKSKVKYLTKWSVDTKQIKSNKGNSKSVITLTGN